MAYTISRSTALINGLVRGYGVRELLRDGRIYVYNGTQPATADLTVAGTNLGIYTTSGGTYGSPTRANCKLTFADGVVNDAVTSIKVGGMGENLLGASVAFSTNAQTTAVLVAAAVNANQNALNITAVAGFPGTADVTLYCPYWVGANGNNLTLVAVITQTGGGTLTVDVQGVGSPGTTEAGVFASGVTAQNGLNWLYAVASGVIAKETAVWQMTAIATGNASYFRFVAGGSTHDGVSGADIRFDGSVGVNTSDMTVSSNSIVAGAIYTINTGTIAELVA